ncbi:MAG TPA: zinc-dependent peptidase [Bacteroidales bacterium]|nr:zinc-dependent peptidase [Bacteroidales bacterium]
MESNIIDPSLWIFILFTVFIFISFYFQIKNSEDPFIKRNLKRYLILRNLDKIYKPYLTQYFNFYNSLDEKNKLLFERRVQRFIDLKEFIPRGGDKTVTPEMKAMIAATAIQLTFGYPKVYFLHFWRILIYPDNYYSTITHKYHKGEVNVRGIIVLSWKSFKEGFSNQTDGLNLGFHEMAHALRLINIVENEEYDFYDREIMNEFDKEAKYETIKLINSPEEKSLFRNYGTVNLDEFFSVAIECFFEKSYEFKQYNPKLYMLITKILKIDPNQLYSESYIKNIAS